MTKYRTDAQFWVALVSVIGLAVTTFASLTINILHGQPPCTITTMLAGGLISVCSASASWLFRAPGKDAE